MSAKLERVLKLLINEQHDEAEALLHDWFVEEARNIHEELIAEDEYAFEDEEFELDFNLDDANDEIDSEEFFEDEDDLEFDAEEDDSEGDIEGDLDLDLDVEVDDELDGDLDVDSAEGDLEGDFEVDAEDDVDARLQDLEAQFDELQAMFDELNVGEVDDEDFDDSDDEDEFDDEEDDLDLEDDEDADDEDSDEEDDSDDDFKDLGESFDLEKVSTEAAGEGKTTAGTVPVNKKSATLNKGVNDRVGGKPVETKRDDHKGFNKEEGAKVEAAKARKNVRNKATDDTSNVPEGGDKSALLNKGL